MTILEAVLAIFTAVADWFVEIIPIVISIFWAEGSLTFMGVLAIISLAISVIFLLMMVVENFLHFRS